MNKIIAATLAIALTGCAVQPYVQPRQLTKEESKGLAECKYEAEKATVGKFYSFNSMKKIMEESMDQSRIINLCLKAKGLDTSIDR